MQKKFYNLKTGLRVHMGGGVRLIKLAKLHIYAHRKK